MPSIHNIVDLINDELRVLFECDRLSNSILYPIATTMMRGDEKIPVLVEWNGEGEFVGIDDQYDASLYHKVNGLTSSLKPASGRSQGDQVNTYDMSTVVWMNRLKIEMHPDELLLKIQSFFPDTLRIDPFHIKIVFRGAILNDMQVYNEEYTSVRHKLLPEHNLFKINYSVEAVFPKGCFNTCPD